MTDPIVSQTSPLVEVPKTLLAQKQQTERWTYFSPNLSLTRALVSRAESTAAKAAAIAVGTLLAIVEMFILIPVKMTLGNAVIWLGNRCVLDHARKERVPELVHPTVEEAAPTSTKDVVEVSDPVALAAPQQLGRIDIEIQRPTETQPLRVTTYVFARPEDAAEQQQIIDQANHDSKMRAAALNAQSGAKPGDPNYADPDVHRFVLKTSDTEEEGWNTVQEESVLLGAARVQMHKKVSADGTRQLVQQRLWTNPTEDNPTGEVTQDELALILQGLANGSFVKNDAPPAGPTEDVQISEEEQTAAEKMSQLAAKTGLVGATALLALGTLNLCGYESYLVKGALSTLAGYSVYKEANRSLKQGGELAVKEALAMAGIFGVHKAAEMTNRNHWLSLVASTLILSATTTKEVLSQPTVSKAAKSTAASLTGLAAGVGSYYAAHQMGVTSQALTVPLFMNAFSQTKWALQAPTWTDTFKGMAKAGLTFGVGVGVNYGLQYLGVQSDLARSLLSSAATTSVTGALYANSWEEAANRVKKTAFGLGLGTAAHHSYALLGVSPMTQFCNSNCQCVPQEGFLNPMLSSMALSQAHMPREGTEGEKAVEAIKEVTKGVLTNSAIYAGINYLALPAVHAAGAYMGYPSLTCMSVEALAMPALMGYSVYRSGQAMQKLAGEAIDHVKKD